MKQAYKFEIFPTPEQKQYIHRAIGSCRFVWNWLLSQKTKEVIVEGSTRPKRRMLTEPSWGELSKQLTLLKTKPEFLWLNEINAQALVAEHRHLKDAFGRFFDYCK